MEQVVLLLLCLLVGTGLAQPSNLLETVYEWKQMDYEFPSSSVRESMIRQQTFIPENIVPIDVDVWQQNLCAFYPKYYDDDWQNWPYSWWGRSWNDCIEGAEGKVFVTVPKFKPGIPSTLNTVVTNNKGEPLLRPYPDWSWHREGHCDGITSVFRMQMDQCGRLWVLDSGMTDIFTGLKRTCPPQLLVFNVKNDKLLMRYRFPDSVLKDYSILVTVAVDILDPNNRCRNAFAYVADVTGFAIIVVDMHRIKSWRITSNLLYPYPLSGHFNLNGVQFDLMDGVLGLALSPPHNSYQDKTLFFHSLASVRESWVSTDLLRNSTFFEDGINHVPEQFHVSQSERPGQVAAEATDSSGTLFFSILPSNSLNCWNPSRPYETSNLVELARDPERLQFVSGLKRTVKVGGESNRFLVLIRGNSGPLETRSPHLLVLPFSPKNEMVVKDQQNKEWVWMLSDRFQNIMIDNVPQNEVNYRIMKFPVEEMIRGTSCVRTRSAPYQAQPSRPSYSSLVFS